jgi:hypothetical protein
MTDAKTEQIENMEGVKVDGNGVSEGTQAAPAVKVYPTSFLPSKAHLESTRIPTLKMSGLGIEVSHVIIFIGLTIFLFIGIWKRPNHRR